MRVAEVIRRTFGVSYDPSNVSRLPHALHYSVQRPCDRPSQHNEQAIQV